QPDHPLTARVLVNRVWYHHFGNGIVSTLEDFGVKGDPPSHPELLDMLAQQFVARGWSIKALHRIMMLSDTYRQSDHVTDDALRIDPQNRLLSHMPLRRMDAEALRDSLLFVSGALDVTSFGPPDPVSVDRNGLVQANPTAPDRWRRSIYVQYRRTEIPTMMETFDYPEMGPNCVSRSISVVSPQSLLMLNNEHVRHLAQLLAARATDSATEKSRQAAADLSSATSADLVSAVYRIALSRLPDEQEMQLGTATLAELQQQWANRPQQALETYCHTILNSAAFLYVD
ncbi:MAG: DUF1553 domain-containing protein, partial [Planctomycetaceae bacterium]|nr:DUF1553 domain-containing protein [Planctomycetaceae bacterium]